MKASRPLQEKMRKGLPKSAEDSLHPAYQRGLTNARKLGRALETGESPTEEFKESQKGELGQVGLHSVWTNKRPMGLF